MNIGRLSMLLTLLVATVAPSASAFEWGRPYPERRSNMGWQSNSYQTRVYQHRHRHHRHRTSRRGNEAWRYGNNNEWRYGNNNGRRSRSLRPNVYR